MNKYTIFALSLGFTAHKKMSFSPYEQSGGTILAIAGDDFALVASDTRLSCGFQIHSRNFPKIYKLLALSTFSYFSIIHRVSPYRTPTTLLGSCGYAGDVLTVVKTIEARVKLYDYENNRIISTNAVASMLSKMLYYRRFFPYYTYNLVAGLDDEGKGAVYSFDPVGSYEREHYRCGGTASAILQPFLDCQIGFKNEAKTAANQADRPELTMERAITLAYDAFIGAAERDIYTGDSLMVATVTAQHGITFREFPLRKD